jgi:hypothetical protein
MYEVSGELTVILITIWWWLQRLGKGGQEINKQHTSLMGEGFNLRKLNELEVRRQYQIDITNRFVGLENISDSEYINRAWENIKENIKTSVKERLDVQELEQHKPWFDECLGFLDQRKQVKIQWVQDPSQSNVDNVNS